MVEGRVGHVLGIDPAQTRRRLTGEPRGFIQPGRAERLGAVRAQPGQAKDGDVDTGRAQVLDDG